MIPASLAMVRDWANWRKKHVWVPSWRRKQIEVYGYLFGRKVHPDDQLNQGAEDSKHNEVEAPSKKWAKLKGTVSATTKVKQQFGKNAGQYRPRPRTINENAADDSSKLNRPIVTFYVREPLSDSSGPPLLKSVSSVDFSAEEF